MKYLVLPLIALFFIVASCGGQIAGDGVIAYHGGPVMTNPVNVYVIWYGDWQQNDSTEKLVTYFLNHIDSTVYYNIDRAYDQQSGVHVADKVKVVENYYMGSYKGSTLSKADIPAIVSDTINQYRLSPDPDGWYLVLTDTGIQVETICSIACGWHDPTVVNGAPVVFAIVDNTEKCPHVCHGAEFVAINDAGTIGTSPNNDWAADGMINVITHELSESLTDPFINGWNGGDVKGNEIEIGDKCNFNFDDAYLNDKQAIVDITVGTKQFLIQKMWIENDGNGGHCGMQP